MKRSEVSQGRAGISPEWRLLPFFELLSGYEIADKAEMPPRKNNVGRILTLPPIGVPRLRGFLEQGSPDRLKAELRTGQALGLRRGQCQDAPPASLECAHWPALPLCQSGGKPCSLHAF